MALIEYKPGSLTRRGNPKPHHKWETIRHKSEAIKRRNMIENSAHRYQFASTEQAVDLQRIIRETPARTPFVLVELQDRGNHAKGWLLFVHNNILEQAEGKGLSLAGEKVWRAWGADKLGSAAFENYRVVSQAGRFPGKVKVQLEKIKSRLNPVDTKTFVTYL